VDTHRAQHQRQAGREGQGTGAPGHPAQPAQPAKPPGGLRWWRWICCWWAPPPVTPACATSRPQPSWNREHA
jgi:hypothetical protein